jgi:pimeloyl-ACP methyl ester carboxylesterase
MLHGLGSQASDLYPVIEQIRPHVRKVIALDLPAHGWSEIPVEQLPLESFQQSVYQGIDKLLAKEEPVILFGNSLGGWQALRYALHNPQELNSLILVSPAGAQIDAAEHQRLKQIFAEDSVHNPQVMVPLLFNQPPALSVPVAAFLQSRFSQPRVRHLLTMLDERSCLSPAELQQLTPPTLLIWGRQDRIFPQEVTYFKQHLPSSARILEPEHFTHSPYLEAGMEYELGQIMLDWETGLSKALLDADPKQTQSQAHLQSP